jgi:DNA-binding PadR family transcriptional regulator
MFCMLVPTEKYAEHLPLPPAAFFVLFALAEGERHGYRIMQDVRELSAGSVSIGPATLYTTIQRLVDRGFVVEVDSPQHTRRRMYSLTSAGSGLLHAEFQRQTDVLALAKKRRVFVLGDRA